MVQLFEYGLKPSIGRVGRLGLGGAVRVATLGGLEPGSARVRGVGFPIFSASLTRTSRPSIITILHVPKNAFRVRVRDVKAEHGLPSALDDVYRKTLNTNNRTFARSSVLKQDVELGYNHCLQDVCTIRDHDPPPGLTICFDSLRLNNL